ncbi:MAG: DUF4328 domain-containing protein [Planctomycetota bacterium]
MAAKLDNTGQANFLRLMCFVVAGLTVINMGMDFWLYTLIDDVERVRTPNQANAVTATQSAMSLVSHACYAIATIVFLVVLMMWLYRAVSNVRVRTGDSHATPGWSVGWWFIPFANLVVPYRILTDLWKRSGAEERTGSTNLPGIFWGLWIVIPLIVGVVAAGSAIGSSGYGTESMETTVLAGIIQGGFGAAGLIFLQKLVSGVTHSKLSGTT